MKTKTLCILWFAIFISTETVMASDSGKQCFPADANIASESNSPSFDNICFHGEETERLTFEKNGAVVREFSETSATEADENSKCHRTCIEKSIEAHRCLRWGPKVCN
jgi:hypothetical protein